MQSTATGMPVCLSVCWLAYLMLPVAIAQSFSDDNAIRYVLLTSHFHATRGLCIDSPKVR